MLAIDGQRSTGEEVRTQNGTIFFFFPFFVDVAGANWN